MRKFVLAATVFAGIAAYCCTIGLAPVVPSRVVRLSGRVVGTNDPKLADDKLAHMKSPVTGAIVLVRWREDKEMFKPPDRNEEIKKKYLGAVAEWKCGGEITASTVADSNGRFDLDLKTGTYCVQFIEQKPKNDGTVQDSPMQEEFLVDIDPKADLGKELLADLTTRWSDCSGGSEITVVDAQAH